MSTRMVRMMALAFAGTIAACAGSVYADFFQSKGSDDWHDYANSWQYRVTEDDTWGDATRKPQSGDTVTILTGHTITVAPPSGEEAVTTLTIDSGGTLVISANEVLSLAGTNPSATVVGIFTINGNFKLDSSSGAPYIDLQTSRTMPAANGEIQGVVGAAANPEIRINANSAAVTLTNAGTIRGRMAIKGVNTGSNNAVFTNNSIVSADDGTLEVHSSLSSASDNGSAVWRVNAAAGILKFSEGVTLAGAVQMLASGGSLQISANVTTATFRYDAGSFAPTAATLAWTTVVDNCVHTPLLQNNSSLNASFSPCP